MCMLNYRSTSTVKMMWSFCAKQNRIKRYTKLYFAIVFFFFDLSIFFAIESVFCGAVYSRLVTLILIWFGIVSSHSCSFEYVSCCNSVSFTYSHSIWLNLYRSYSLWLIQTLTPALDFVHSCSVRLGSCTALI